MTKYIKMTAQIKFVETTFYLQARLLFFKTLAIIVRNENFCPSVTGKIKDYDSEGISVRRRKIKLSRDIQNRFFKVMRPGNAPS